MNQQTERSRLLDALAQVIAKHPGLTQLELTRSIFGPDLLYSLVTAQIARLIDARTIRREGLGGKGDPYRYYPVTNFRIGRQHERDSKPSS